MPGMKELYLDLEVRVQEEDLDDDQALYLTRTADQVVLNVHDLTRLAKEDQSVWQPTWDEVDRAVAELAESLPDLRKVDIGVRIDYFDGNVRGERDKVVLQYVVDIARPTSGSPVNLQVKKRMQTSAFLRERVATLAEAYPKWGKRVDVELPIKWNELGLLP